MQINTIYEEKVPAKWITGILAVFTAVFFLLLVHQTLIEPFGTHPDPNGFYLLMFLLFLGVLINFSRLSIKMTPRSIDVGYGIFKHKILWENVGDCYLDETSTIQYGG